MSFSASLGSIRYNFGKGVPIVSKNARGISALRVGGELEMDAVGAGLSLKPNYLL